jgi:hypothetical protein
MLGLFRISARVSDLEMALNQLRLEFKFYKDEFEKHEIKSLESRKTYAKKLKQLEQNEEENSDKDLLDSVFIKDR